MPQAILKEIVKFFGQKFDSVIEAIKAIQHPEIKIPEFPKFPEFPEFPEEMSIELKNAPEFPKEIEVNLKNGFPTKIVVEIPGIEKMQGYTPKKGVDYLTPEEITEIKKEITPVKGVDYHDGEPGTPSLTPKKGVDYFTKEEVEAFKADVTPVKGVNYRDGEDGYSPKKGVDYRDGEDGSPDTGKEIIEKVNKDKSKEVIKKEKVEGIKDIEEDIKTLRTDTQNNSSFFTKFAGDTVRLYDLSSLLNGVTKTFTLPAGGQVLLVTGSSTPWFFRPTVDYTTTASSITFTSQIDETQTLATGQSVGILYKIP